LPGATEEQLKCQDCHPLSLFCLQISYTVFQFTYISYCLFSLCLVGEFNANVHPDVEAIAAAALSGMEMGSVPGLEGFEDADNEKSKAMENGKSGKRVNSRITSYIVSVREVK